MSNKTVGFEYKRKEKETPFETFLRYTDEKEKSAGVLSELLKKHIKKEVDILDIGSGNGEYLRLALGKAKFQMGLNLVLLEPSNDLVREIKKSVNLFPETSSIKIVNRRWEDYVSKDRFDVIIASHLYHIPRERYYAQFSKMVSYLKKDGVLIFVLRSIDDPHHFKTKFKPVLFGEKFKAKTLDEAIKIFKEISNKDARLIIKEYDSLSKLKIPYKSNMEDAISIIEFYLNKHWEDIPKKIQNEVTDFIKEKHGVFKQVDGLAVIKRA